MGQERLQLLGGEAQLTHVVTLLCRAQSDLDASSLHNVLLSSELAQVIPA
jgi:hypothetical protein